MMEEQKKDLVFLSYAKDDLAMAWKVYEGLKRRNVSVWFDKVDLKSGKWKPQIEKQIPKCRFFIFCASKASIKKTEEGIGFVDDELQTAWKISEAQNERKFTILPVRLEECGRGDHRLSTFQQFDLFEDFEKGLDRLAINIGGRSIDITKADEVKKEDKKLLELLLKKAKLACYSGDHKKALSLFDAAISIDPENQEAWEGKRDALEVAGNKKSTIAAYDKTASSKSKFHKLFYNN